MKRNDYLAQFDLFITICIFCLLFFLYSGNLWNGDRIGYENYYHRESLGLWGLEVGYGALNLIFYKLGISYQLFQSFIALVSLLLISQYLKKVSYLLSVSLLLYLIVMFSLDYVLMRTTLAYAIVLNGFYYLYQGERLKYIMLVFIASLFHQSSLIFSIFLFLPYNYKNIQISKYIYLSIAMILIAGAIRLFGLLPNNIASHLNYYLPSVKSTIFSVCVHIICISLVYFDCLVNLKNEDNKKYFKYIEFIKAFNIVSILLLFLYFQADIFIRIFRLIVFVNLIYIVQLSIMTKRISYYALIYVVIFSIYLIMFYIYPTTQYSLFPLIKHNFLYEYYSG